MFAEPNKFTEQSIGRYRKIFGVGPLGLLIGIFLFGLLSLIDREFGHIPIIGRPGTIRAIGLIFIAIWICWHIWGLKTLRLWIYKNSLCTSGPFRYVRHPLYAGVSLLGSMGISLTFNSWIMLLLPFLLFSVFSILVRREEKMMYDRVDFF